MSKKFIIALALVLVLAMASMSTLACTTIYVGKDLTTDGSYYFGRSEDYSNSYNKLYTVKAAGTYKAGETYEGCYGFTWTWTHDSYASTAFSDDNGEGVANECPDCGDTHDHNPYQAAGTNEKGVSMSATETLGCSDAVYDADPYNEETGIEEAEIPTVILSEAATAREGVDLLLSIYDSVGCQGGSGIIIADANEAWYIENVTGTAYVAVKLSSSMVFTDPNMSVIGLIDLDDTDNVIASANLIEVAKKAGTYVGDEAANTINFVASYNADETANSRMQAILPFLSAENTKEEYTTEDFCISNVDAEGNIVPMYTNIKVDRAMSIEDIVDFYHLSVVGTGRSTETHIFNISDASATGTVEWVAVNDPSVGPFVPYYPMLTTDTYDAYKLSTVTAEYAETLPETGLAYATTRRVRTEDGVKSVDCFRVIPSCWADSYYWTVDVLSHLRTEETTATVAAMTEELQNQCFAAFAELKATVEAADDKAAAATSFSNLLAASMHKVMVETANEIIK